MSVMEHSSAQALGQSVILTIQPEQVKKRVDIFLTEYFDQHSRSFFQNLVKSGNVVLNGSNSIKSSILLKLGDVLEVHFPPVRQIGQLVDATSSAPFRCIFEHDDFFIIEKDAGIAVHPGSSHSKELTLSDWLVAACNDLAEVGDVARPGIVHRLDKDTSGLMIIPRTSHAHAKISALFKDRKIQKTYGALVEGSPGKSGTLDYTIARHPLYPHKMTAGHYIIGRQSITHYETISQSSTHAFLKLKPVTGRTHQIRVHCATAGFPLVGDSVYGQSSDFISRQALHASELQFVYDGTEYNFVSELPSDIVQAKNRLGC